MGGTIRTTSQTAPASGSGLEMFWGGAGIIRSFNRSANTFADSYLDGASLYLNATTNGTVYIGSGTFFQQKFDASGFTTPNNITSTNGLIKSQLGYQLNSNYVINSFGQFVGSGVYVPTYGITAAGFNPFTGSSVGVTGLSTNTQYNGVPYATVTFPSAVTVCTTVCTSSTHMTVVGGSIVGF
jgi:hypothetical protein